jgi:hypothetical protein
VADPAAAGVIDRDLDDQGSPPRLFSDVRQRRHLEVRDCERLANLSLARRSAGWGDRTFAERFLRESRLA